MSELDELRAQLASLRSRVDVLEAREQIQLLRNRFHELVNADGWDRIGELFAEHAELDYDYLGKARGRAAIGKFFAAIPRLMPTEGGGPFVRQFIHGHSVTVDGDSATGTSFLFATPIYHGVSFLLAGRFADRYVRRDGRWWFASVALEIDYSVPLSEGWSGPDRHRMRL